MTYMPRVAAATEAKWADLAAELDRWEETGRTARLWWRDDDAVAPTPALDRLLELARGIPLGLAVVPEPAEPALAERLAGEPLIALLQHGWRHANHALAGKKSEYPSERDANEVAVELVAGQKRLGAMFGARALPVLVPPWNRFADCFMPLLAENGINAISQQAPRKTPSAAGVAAIDVHLDVTAWHAGRGFVGIGAALGRLIAELRARRMTGDDNAIGVLTHHLVMDAATEAFLARLGEAIERHPAARWSAVSDLMAAP
jgi:hypothetical protein